jgi:hypothetical protein
MKSAEEMESWWLCSKGGESGAVVVMRNLPPNTPPAILGWRTACLFALVVVEYFHSFFWVLFSAFVFWLPPIPNFALRLFVFFSSFPQQCCLSLPRVTLFYFVSFLMLHLHFLLLQAWISLLIAAASVAVLVP